MSSDGDAAPHKAHALGSAPKAGWYQASMRNLVEGRGVTKG
jgi:hypothetical protein